MLTAARPRPASLLLPLGLGLALAGLMTAVHPEGTTPAEPEAPTCIGCHHGPDPAPGPATP